MCCKQLKYPEIAGKPVYGGKDCAAVTKTPANGDGFKIGSIDVKALYTPCHTQDSISWFMQDGDERVVFTGDTLFHGGKQNIEAVVPVWVRLLILASGCGRFFEGKPEEMHTALNKTLAALPDDTKVYVSPTHLSPMHEAITHPCSPAMSTPFLTPSLDFPC